MLISTLRTTRGKVLGHTFLTGCIERSTRCIFVTIAFLAVLFEDSQTELRVLVVRSRDFSGKSELILLVEALSDFEEDENSFEEVSI